MSLHPFVTLIVEPQTAVCRRYVVRRNQWQYLHTLDKPDGWIDS